MTEPSYDEYETDDDGETYHRRETHKDQDLKHLKLVFPTYTEEEPLG